MKAEKRVMSQRVASPANLGREKAYLALFLLIALLFLGGLSFFKHSLVEEGITGSSVGIADINSLKLRTSAEAGVAVISAFFFLLLLGMFFFQNRVDNFTESSVVPEKRTTEEASQKKHWAAKKGVLLEEELAWLQQELQALHNDHSPIRPLLKKNNLKEKDLINRLWSLRK